MDLKACYMGLIVRLGPVRIIVLVFSIVLFLDAAMFAEEAAAKRGIGFEIESGPVWQGLNDVEIPNDGTATRFSLSDLVGTGPYLSYRLYLSYTINGRHQLRLLLAPFKLEESGVTAQPIRFENRDFVAGSPLSATYRFNSYRLTYSYRFYYKEYWQLYIGFTGKIRDAEVALTQGFSRSSNSNIGFVPLLHFKVERRFSGPLSLELDADFLAAPQGRAEDLSVKLHYYFRDGWFAAVGYRMLEGGADVEDVYTFAWFHYAVFSLGCTL